MTILNANEYITKGEAVQVLHTAYAEGRIQAKDGCASVLDDIGALKAADVQPIKHGRWIWVQNYRDCEGDIYSQYKCSCCDFGVGGIYFVKDLTHFCGNCGARMDGDTNG